MATISIDAQALARRLRVAPSKIKRVARNALNDAARELRASTPAIIRRAVDRPVPLTARVSGVIYQAASYDSLTSSIRLAPIQAGYLSPGEHGQRTGMINTPIARDAVDGAGNLKKRFRWTPAERAQLLAQTMPVTSRNARGGQRRIGKFFFGRPHGYQHAGLFERPKDPSRPLRRITMIAKGRRYQPQFGIRRAWQRLGGPMLDRHLRIQADHPANRL